MSMLPNDDSIQIREVWNDNLESEMTLIRGIVDHFPFVAMDTAFPGTVFTPVGAFQTATEYHYETLRTNVNLLKMIQLGLTFSDEKGNLPTCGPDNNSKYCIWQFNFREFDLSSDNFSHDSIDLLRRSGIDFAKNNRNGVDSRSFAELLMSFGIVMNENVHWVMFHGVYDFSYLLKLLSSQDLPETLKGFTEMIRVYFPRFYDIKHLAKFCDGFSGGLNKLADLLGVERVGICHQAGSDSLLTSHTFMSLRQDLFNGSTEKYSCVLFGFGVQNGQ